MPFSSSTDLISFIKSAGSPLAKHIRLAAILFFNLDDLDEEKLFQVSARDQYPFRH